LSLLDQQFLIFRFVYPLCGPFQYSFHGYGYFDARKTKRYGIEFKRKNGAKGSDPSSLGSRDKGSDPFAPLLLIRGFSLFYTNNKPFSDGKASGA
jgi:hypothetical protein